MNVRRIHITDDFQQQFLKIPAMIQRKASKTEKIFRENAFHPSLRLHKLKGKLDGLWSISVERKYRIIFKPQEDGVMLFISMGLHAIYER